MVTTSTCSHVFCQVCLETWLKRSDKCPLCSQEQRTLPQSLQSSQPVAFRVLSRIHVKCPLQQHHVRCSWKGDYGDLQAHLLSSTAHVVVPPATEGPVQTVTNEDVDDDHDEDQVMCDDSLALAKAFKDEANAKFASHNFEQARELYSKGIHVLPSPNAADDDPERRMLLATLYANRAAAALALEQYWDCRSDCEVAIQYDPSYHKAYVRRTKACLELGLFDDAVAGLEQACASNPSNAMRFQQDLQRTKQARDQFRTATELLSQGGDPAAAQAILGALLTNVSRAPAVVMAAARANVVLGQTETAQRLSLQVLRQHPQYAPAYVVRGLSLCWAGDFDGGLKVLREGLRLDPDNEETKVTLRTCKKMQQSLQEARHFVFHRKFEQAVEAFGQALESLGSTKAPLYAILHSERAQVHLRLKDFEKALRDAGRAIYARDDLEQAWLIKIQALQGLNRNVEARDELEDLLQNKWGSNSQAIRKAYERADFLVRKEQRPDFYKLLGVSPIASLMEIKKQYKVKAMEYHPDKWMSATEEEREKAEHNFKLLGEGLEILSDDFQRQLYDEGYDAHAIRERVAAAQQAAHRPQNYHHGHHH